MHRSKAPSVPSCPGRVFRVRVSDTCDSAGRTDTTVCPRVSVITPGSGARAVIGVVWQNARISCISPRDAATADPRPARATCSVTWLQTLYYSNN